MPRITKFEADLRRAFSGAPEDNLQLALRVLKEDDREWLLELADKRNLPRYAYQWPNRNNLRLALLDSLLGTHGVEELAEGKWRYLNVGDAYTATVVWYRSSGRFYMRCYADIVEAYRIK